MRKQLTELNKNGLINGYLYYHLFNRLDYLDQNTGRDLIREAQELTKMGIESEDDHKHFAYIRMHLKKIALDIAGPLNTNTIAKLSLHVYHNRNYYPIDTIPNFYKAVKRGLDELDIPIKKSAYPVSSETYDAKEGRDVGKWLQGMREIYELIHRGYTFEQAFDTITEHWDVMEKSQYKAWIQYYSSGENMKYKTAEKTAQVGYHIPYDAIRVREPDMNDIRSGIPSAIHREVSAPKTYQPTSDDSPPSTLRSGELPSANVEQINKNNVDKRIQAIIGRLRAAEKLTENSDVIARLKELLDMDVREWLGLLHKLKTSLVLVPIRHASSTILEDLIIKEANKLIKRGKVNAGRLLISIAQEPMEDTTVSNPSQSPMKTESTPTPIGTPGDVGPAPLPAQGPPPLESPPIATPELSSAPMEAPKSDGDEAMDEFIGKLNMEYPEEADKGKADDSYADDKITVVAQEMMREPGPAVPSKLKSPTKPLMPHAPPPVPPPTEIEEGPKPHIKVEEEPELDNFDLDNVRVADIVKRLEMVSNVIKNREIPRQLAIVDLMLDKLGIAAFFPTLAEATRSSLESNQYMATRVEDILGKLRGSLEHKEEVNLAPEKDESRDHTIDAVKRNLQNEDAKQKELKEQRQALRDKEVAEPTAPIKKETPKELAGPVNVQKAPPGMMTR
jgi:hypothetical protein